ncbi:Radical S-adenosyl methionine domain-containing protein 2 [Myotis brandtii]|uniref:Radical S-adenosyl methionine domain-containing protein 2 n=1 Tax=Myotis brandtii TaxID=109478 RepID=S7PD99_MYOBR|nr:Radical S-adenosyl methionine domain-containing protein 2 [Myotis brandtii]
MEKVNFSGGEPFLQDRGEYLGRLVRFCKQELGLPSVSIVSNGSLIRERWFVKYGQYLDILAISCDSFNEDVNVLIGRGQGRLNHVENLRKLRRWCREYRVAFKINSVINRFNVDEDMRAHIQELNPVRWKVSASGSPTVPPHRVGGNSFGEVEMYLDILAISCDSFNEDVNVLIGRGQGRLNHVENLRKLRRWCREYRVAFKINSVINRFNVDEDMRAHIQELNPVRWKVFQCLLIDGENAGEGALREAERFVISKEEFQGFLDRHRGVPCLVPECNDKMKDSYLILDEYVSVPHGHARSRQAMRFLNCREGRKDPSRSILDVGVQEAIKFSGFDEESFLKRGGKYVWSKADLKLDW